MRRSIVIYGEIRRVFDSILKILLFDGIFETSETRIVRESAIGFGVLFNPFLTDGLCKIDTWRTSRDVAKTSFGFIIELSRESIC